MKLTGFSAISGLAVVCLAVACFSLLTPAANAQLLQGAIDGNVTDSTQAAIIGAKVSITNEATNATRETVTNEAGSYSFLTIDTGSYTLTVNTPGFQAYTATGLTVSINAVVRMDVELEVGAVTETVTVEASAAVLQTDRAEVRQEVTSKTLENIPIPLGRNYQMMFVTLPGFTPPTNAHSIPSNPSRAVRFSVNGTTRSNNNTRVDGASQTNIWLPHMVSYLPALESIESVNIVTNSFDAEQGLAGGAAINVQIKSGSNNVHGSLFEYNSNNNIKAYPYNSDRTQPKPKYIYNQFGATIGGPIKKDKLFYFVSYEGTYENQFGSAIVDVPSAAMKTGDLMLPGNPEADRLIYDPLTGNADATGRIPFANKQIPQSRISNYARAIIDTGDWPDPNLPGKGGLAINDNYIGGSSVLFHRDTVDSKVNWQASDKITMFVRFSFLDFRASNPQIFGFVGGPRLHPTNSNPGDGFGNTYSGTISGTYVATPNLIFDAYFGYTLQDTNIEQANLDENIGFDFLGVPGLQSSRKIDGGWPYIRIDGFDNLGITNNFEPYYRSDPGWQWVGNMNWTKGAHNIRAGTDIYYQHLNHNQPEMSGAIGGASGGWRHRSGLTGLKGGPRTNDLNSMAAFLLGHVREGGKIFQFNEDGYTTRTQLFSAFLRDRWQVSPKLTMTLGMRWEYYPFPTRADRGLEDYDFDNNVMRVCGVGTVPKNCGVEVQKSLFAPRLGLAYRLTDTFVMRAGYGITIDPFNWARPMRTNYPIMFVQNLPFANSRTRSTTLDEGFPVILEPDLGNGVIPIAGSASVVAIPHNLERGYIQSWNFTLEKRFLGDFIGTAGYVATRSLNQLYNLNANYGLPGGGNASKILNQQFGRTANTTRLGSMPTHKYDSLQLKLERRFSAGYQIQMAYTWSHSLGYGGDDSGDGTSVDIPWMYNLNYGDSPLDQLYNFQFTFMGELPFGKGKRWVQEGVAAAILGGWQFNTLASRYSGDARPVGANSDDLDAPGSGQRADCLSKPIYLGDRDQWYDVSTFAQPEGPRFGTCDPRPVRGPGLFNTDFGLFRKFQITEGLSVQFRAEMFNAFNTPHFFRFRDNVNNSNFMILRNSIRNTGREGIDERLVRFGIRIGW